MELVYVLPVFSTRDDVKPLACCILATFAVLPRGARKSCALHAYTSSAATHLHPFWSRVRPSKRAPAPPRALHELADISIKIRLGGY